MSDKQTTNVTDPAEPDASVTCSRCQMTFHADDEFCPHCGAKVGPHRKVAWWHLHRRMYDWTLAWAYKPSAAIALFVMSFAESSFFPIPPDVLLMPLVLGNRKKWFRYALTCSIASVSGAVAGFLIGMFLWGAIGPFFHDHVPGFSRDEIVLKQVNAAGGIEAGDKHGETIEGFIPRDRLEMVNWHSAGPVYPLTITDKQGQTHDIQADQVAEAEVGKFSTVGKQYEKYNFWIVFTAGFTPLPFKVITITAGVFGTAQGAVANPAVFFGVFLLAAAISRSARFFLVAGLMRLFGPKITPFIDKYLGLLALAFTALLIGGFLVFKMVL